MSKYTEKDIVRGKRVLKNGMLAGFVLDNNNKERFRIIGKYDQTGGSASVDLKAPIDLKTAVSLLQQYYQTKYY